MKRGGCGKAREQGGRVLGNGRLSSGIVILPSKINTPVLSADIVPRKELAAKLKRSLSCRLTSFISSAGYGKTTSVVAWTRSLKGVPSAWFLLDAEDRSLDRFWLYLTAALRVADEGICHAFDEVRMADDSEVMKPVLDSLLVQMAQYDRDFVLVIEDFHAVHDYEGINETMVYLLKRLPANAHVVITSRQELGFPVSKMRVEGTLNEIGEDDLRFSEEETDDFFSKVGLKLAESEREAVRHVTHGWPSGCRLVALLGSGSSGISVVEAAEKAKGSINDYLFEEVFQDLPESLQQFMVKTSAVRSFCLPLAERMTGLSRDEALARLDYLVCNNLFIEKVEHGSGEDWYRYHLLLADMLHVRLARSEREEVEGMLRAARDWFEEEGFLDYVVELSADLGDCEKIRMVIVRNWLAAYMNDSQHSLIRWASFLSDDEMFKSPLVCAALAMPCALDGEMEKGRSLLAHAVSCLHGEKDFLYAFCMVQEAFLASFENRSEAMLRYTDLALGSLSEDEFYLRGMMSQVRAAACLDIDPLQAKAAFYETVKMQCGFGNKTLSCSAYCNLATVSANLGHLDEARHYSDLAFSLYEPGERPFKPMLSYAYLTQMVCAYEEGSFEETLRFFELLNGVSSEGTVLGRFAEAMTVRAKALFRLASPDAGQVFVQALSLHESGALQGYPTFSMVKEFGKTFVSQAAEMAMRDATAGPARVFCCLLACFSGRLSRYEEACLFAENVDADERFLKAHALLVAAVFSEEVGQRSRAEAYLHDALTLCERHGLAETILGNAEQLTPLAQRMVKTCEEPTGSLLNQLAMGVTMPKTPPLLTDRETDVMKLVASGTTIAEAAAQLYLSRDTVKKHLANVYAKLGVHSKMQAVALLRERSIL